jgi:hypothetical protein
METLASIPFKRQGKNMRLKRAPFSKFLLMALLVQAAGAAPQTTVLLDDDFQDLSSWKDWCGIQDIHIGGLTPVPFLLAALDAIGERSVEADLPILEARLGFTHHGAAIANARCGGDNVHRGSVAGSLLAAANEIPERWLRGLKSLDRLRCDTFDSTL